MEKKLYKRKLGNLQPSPIVYISKSKRLRWMEHALGLYKWKKVLTIYVNM
jgi:hypothetical protein